MASPTLLSRQTKVRANTPERPEAAAGIRAPKLAGIAKCGKISKWPLELSCLILIDLNLGGRIWDSERGRDKDRYGLWQKNT
jgi:hypothetical protein